MVDQRTMAQLLQAPTEGYEDAIVVPVITADNFELKHGLLTLVQNKPFCGLDKEDPHAHIRYFNKITSTEACDRFKDLLRACPHHGFSELHQLDTFYNALNSNDQDSLNFAAGDNFLDKIPRDCLAIIESKSKVRYSQSKEIVAKVGTSSSTPGVSPDVSELQDMPSTTRSKVSYDGPQVPPPPSSLLKVVEHEPEVTKDTVQPSIENIQPLEIQTQNDKPVVAPKTKPTIPYPSRINKEKLYKKDDILTLKFVEMFRNLHFELSFADALLHMHKFAPMFRKLLNNKDKIIDLIKTPVNENCSAVILKKFPEKLGDPGRFLIPCDFSEMDECIALANLVGTFLFPADFLVIDYIADPRVPLILRRPFLRTARALIDVHGEQMTLRHDDQSITFKVGNTKTFSYNTIESVNRVDVIDVACEEFAQEVLGSSNISKSANPTPILEPILSTSPTSHTPFEGGDFILEEIEACLTSESIPPGIDDADFDPKENILTLKRFLNSDLLLLPKIRRTKIWELRS
ncbi:hypothetical protein Tco_0779458 [Tanacetum coccineum]